jgi:hypothetical protein
MNNVKVIMMTALGQAEDRARGEKLGVVKYLVKSQVTLEDFVRTVREVLPPDHQAQASADAADKPSAQDNQSTNKQESEQSMQDDNTNPTTSPAGDQPSDTNPVSGGDSSGASSSDPMSAKQQQDVVNDQVDSAMGGGASSDAGSTDTSPTAPPADTGPTMPPADEPKPEEGSPTPPASA